MTKQDLPQVQSLKQGIEWDRQWLERLLREYRAEHGPVMRPYRRDLCRKVIRDIRCAQMNLASWGDLA